MRISVLFGAFFFLFFIVFSCESSIILIRLWAVIFFLNSFNLVISDLEVIKSLVCEHYKWLLCDLTKYPYTTLIPCAACIWKHTRLLSCEVLKLPFIWHKTIRWRKSFNVSYIPIHVAESPHKCKNVNFDLPPLIFVLKYMQYSTYINYSRSLQILTVYCQE